MEIVFMTPTITKSLSLGLATPAVDIAMWEVGLGMCGLSVLALGLAVAEKYTDLDLDLVGRVFGSSLPILFFLLLGWFFWQITGMFTPFLW